MTVNEINPDAVILQQLQGADWQKLVAMLVWKLSPGEVVRLTAKDMEEYSKQQEAGTSVFFIQGHKDSLEFSTVTEAQAKVLAAHDKTQRGHG